MTSSICRSNYVKIENDAYINEAGEEVLHIRGDIEANGTKSKSAEPLLTQHCVFKSLSMQWGGLPQA